MVPSFTGLPPFPFVVSQIWSCHLPYTLPSYDYSFFIPSCTTPRPQLIPFVNGRFPHFLFLLRPLFRPFSTVFMSDPFLVRTANSTSPPLEPHPPCSPPLPPPPAGIGLIFYQGSPHPRGSSTFLRDPPSLLSTYPVTCFHHVVPLRHPYSELRQSGSSHNYLKAHLLLLPPTFSTSTPQDCRGGKVGGHPWTVHCPGLKVFIFPLLSFSILPVPSFF